MKRKTYPVEKLRVKVNEMILNSPDERVHSRESLGILLEIVLFDTGNYNGFRWLSENDMLTSTHGIQPGIRLENQEDRFYQTDNSRKRYN
jgi:hypothetical protein